MTRTARGLFVVSALWIAACGGTGVDTSKLHSDCSSTACPSGQTCVSYYGIAGPAGPQFKSCEIPCSGAIKCPGTLTCVTIADGPGQVCD